eukprot:403364570
MLKSFVTLQIILMLPENHACNARNPYPGTIYFEADHKENFYCDDVEVDYKGDDLTYETILNILRGRYSNYFPNSKRLNANEKTKIFIYMNGHGGENFFKIQDTEVLHSEDFGKVFNEMNIKHLYSDILLIVDTCEAMTLFDQVNAPNILMIGSSILGEHAFSHQVDEKLNTYVNDKFTYYLFELMRSKNFNRKVRISDFPSLFPSSKLDSTLEIKNTYKVKTADQVYLHEYIPIDREDVIGGKGIDKNQEGLKFYDYSDFNENSFII